ncbi:MAG: hypothetical protein JW982_06400 [Spirochaetes bacterium]|nr:hypothetical protein [Spirochaetota bacterium]
MEFIDQNFKGIEGLVYPENGKVLYQEDFENEQHRIGHSILDRETDRFTPGIVSGLAISENETYDGVIITEGVARDAFGRRIRINNSVEFLLEIDVPKKIILKHTWTGEEYTPLGSPDTKTIRKNSGELILVTNDYMLLEDEQFLYAVSRDDLHVTINKLFSESALIGYPKIYDHIIDSQEKWDTLISSYTWLGAKNILITCDLTYNGSGIYVPMDIIKIHAINNAQITFVGVDNYQPAFGYPSSPTGIGCEIDGLTIDVTPASGQSIGSYIKGFANFTRMTNCKATIHSNAGAIAFYFCKNLSNCEGIGIGSGGSSPSNNGVGFQNCENLYGCFGYGDGSTQASGRAFWNCWNLVNCKGYGLSVTGTGYGYYDVSYAVGCRKYAIASKTSVWGGTTTKRDDDSCDLT